jgi:hypothetical protein
MGNGAKTTRRNIVFSDEEDAALADVMKQTGFTRSVLIRLALRGFLQDPPPVIKDRLTGCQAT